MRRYRKRRYRRAVVSAPAYTVTRKLVKNLTGLVSQTLSTCAASAQICLNPSNLTLSDRAGSVITVSPVPESAPQCATLMRSSASGRLVSQFAGGWICVWYKALRVRL